MSMRRFVFSVLITLFLWILPSDTPPTADINVSNAWLEDKVLALEIEMDIPDGYALVPEDFRVEDSEDFYFLNAEFLTLQEKNVYTGIQSVLAGQENYFHLYLEYRDEIVFPLSIDISYQLCEEEICYMPVSRTLTINEDDIAEEPLPVQQVTPEEDKPEREMFDEASVMLIFILFGMGLLSSLTPCIYPMIPITLGIIGVHSENTLPKNLLRAFLFVTGMTISFSILGVLSAFTGFIIGEWLGSIWFLVFITVLFMAMAFSLFGLYTFRLPFKQGQAPKFKGGVLSLLIMGIISGFLLSPCIGPVVVGILGMIARTGNPWLGLGYMGVYGYGLGLPLIILGTFAGTLARLPRSGMWMDEIKKVLGILLYLAPLFFWYYYLPRAGFFILTSFFLFPLPVLTRYVKDFLSDQHEIFSMIKGILSSICILLSLFFLLQGTLLMHGTAPAPPSVEEKTEITWYSSVEEALPEAEEKEKPVFANVTAPWCALCQVYKEYFQEPEIRQILGNFILVELQYDSEIGEKYDILGIPQLLFFSSEGEELENTRIIGLKEQEEFKEALQEILQNYES